MIIEEFESYRIAYKLKETGDILGYSNNYDTYEIANRAMNNGSKPTEQVETFIVKETVKRETIPD